MTLFLVKEGTTVLKIFSTEERALQFRQKCIDKYIFSGYWATAIHSGVRYLHGPGDAEYEPAVKALFTVEKYDLDLEDF